MLYKNNDMERPKLKVTPRIHWFSKVLLYLINGAGYICHYIFIVISPDILSQTNMSIYLYGPILVWTFKSMNACSDAAN